MTKEFWLTRGNCVFTTKEIKDEECAVIKETTHVIEYSAYEKLIEETREYIYNFENSKECDCCSNNQAFIDDLEKLINK